MISLTEKYARKVGCIDALIFFAVWVGIGMAIATRPVETLPLVTMILAPASVLVGWRGAASARAILNGDSSFRHAVFEGFYWGAGFAFIVWLWGFFSNAALAAGTVFDGLSPLQGMFWLIVANSLIPVLCIAGACGAVTGGVLHFINLRLVRANSSLNSDLQQDNAAPRHGL